MGACLRFLAMLSLAVGGTGCDQGRSLAIGAPGGGQAAVPGSAAAPRSSGGVVPVPTVPSTPAALDVASNDADYAAERFGTQFALGAFDDLLLRLRFADVAPPARTLAIEVYEPSGGRLGVHRRNIEGREVQVVIPVAGTEITRRQMVGKFTLVAKLDGEVSTIATRTITLTAP